METLTSGAETDVTLDDLLGATYTGVSRPCDLVMKGGVTSGIVYPLAICRLAMNYAFRSIGGTSAGAIAAALAAAAEYSRREGRNGFNQFAQLPAWIGSGTNLQDLFQPSARTRPLFDTLLALVGSSKTLSKRLGDAGWMALRGFWRAYAPPVVLLIAAWLAIGVVWGRPQLRLQVPLLIVSIVLAIVLATLRSMWTTLRVHVPDNYYGMCTGLSRLPGKPPPLTPWLCDTIDTFAGVSAPLTFGQLWRVRNPDGSPATPAPAPTGDPIRDDFAQRAARSLNLEMVTTNTTIGRPYRLPFSELEDVVYYYDPAELADFFPAAIVKHLDSNRSARWPAQATWMGSDGRSRTIYPLPDPDQFPVAMAARMSLSFPLLFSAVPLYAIKKPGMHFAPPGQPLPPPLKCWFSDGGISSNIPVHFFDNPLPRWPTFALNLRGTVPGRPPVAMATENDPDTNVLNDSGPARLPQFLAAVLDSMQNWVDNTQMRLPGSMERVVEFQLDGTEGGMNLTMPESTRKTLAGFGVTAGNLLVRNFSATTSATPRWSEHRWIRYRNFMTGVQEWLWRFEGGWTRPVAPDPPYTQLHVAPSPDAAYSSGFPWTQATQAASAAVLAASIATIAADAPIDLACGAPEPNPQLHLGPRT